MLKHRLLILAALVLLVAALTRGGNDQRSEKVGFGELLTMVERGSITRAELDGRDHTMTAWTTTGRAHETGYPQDYGDELVGTLRAHDVAFTVKGTKANPLVSMLSCSGVIVLWFA